jgi:cytidine deaminase
MWYVAMRDNLIAAARAAAANAHAPYSGFGVGAALLLADGSIITGCNFENASYGMTLCAETVAIASLNALGRLREVREVAVTGGLLKDGRISGIDPVTPCGRCRQILHEAAQMAGVDLPVHCAAAEGDLIATYQLSDLLPHAFGPKDLGFS